jgi:hypothetical protein
MANKSVSNKASKKESKPGVNEVNKKNNAPGKIADKKQKTPPKKPSGILAEAVGRSSSRDVRGSSGLGNTGTIISYD